jgi:hypothetical protein
MSTNDIQTMTETAKSIFEATGAIIDKMQDGDRKQIQELADEVGSAVSMESKKVLGFVSHFIHNSSVVYVSRGKNGGIIKGIRPAKVVKAGKKADTSSDE